MGWVRNDTGVWGDEAADALAGALQWIEARSVEKSGKRPSGAVVLASLLAALNYDSTREPFTSGRYRLEHLTLRREGEALTIAPAGKQDDFVAAFHGALDEMAELYIEAHGRPPTVPEVLAYLVPHFDDADDDEGITPMIADPGGWKLANAKVARSTTAKPEDRPDAPINPLAVAENGGNRVRHKKFGTGVIVKRLDGNAEVLFDSGERKRINRDFLEVID